MFRGPFWGHQLVVTSGVTIVLKVSKYCTQPGGLLFPEGFFAGVGNIRRHFLAGVSLDSLRSCPNHTSLRLLMVLLQGTICGSPYRSVFDIVLVHFTRTTFLRSLLWNESMVFSKAFVSTHSFELHRKILSMYDLRFVVALFGWLFSAFDGF